MSEEEDFTTKYRRQLSLEDGIYDKIRNYSYVEFKAVTKKGKYYFSFKYDDESNVPSLYYRKKINGNESLLVKPDEFKEYKKEVLSINSYTISSDSKYLAVSFSINGADRSIIRVIDLDNGKALPDKIEDVKFASMSWKGNGFCYYRFDTISNQDKITAANKHPKIFYHKLNTAQIDDILVYQNPTSIDSIKINYFDFDITSDGTDNKRLYKL